MGVIELILVLMFGYFMFGPLGAYVVFILLALAVLTNTSGTF